MLAGSTRTSTFPSLLLLKREKRNCSIKSSSLDPPDVGRLAETARISLTPQEVNQKTNWQFFSAVSSHPFI